MTEHNKPKGLKSQHVASIEWLAGATGADVEGLRVGSETLSFRPRRGPGGLAGRRAAIRAGSPAASATLVFQAVLPFLLYAGGGRGGGPVELAVSGGTNVSFSPSYEYLDQVALPALEGSFGVRVERGLVRRGWSSGGAASRGELWFRVQPLPLGTALSPRGAPSLGALPGDFDVKLIDVTIITPADMHGDLEGALREDLEGLFPGASLDFRPPEDSEHESRIYVLLVARSDRLRWGRDVLYGGKRKGQSKAELSKKVAKAVAEALGDEVRRGGVVDGFLQDQLVIFQALAQGQTSFPRHARPAERNEPDGRSADAVDDLGLEELQIGEGLRRDRVKGPLGDPETDSSHTRTARWVTSEILEPGVKWYNKGVVCEGTGFVSGSGGVSS